MDLYVRGTFAIAFKFDNFNSYIDTESLDSLTHAKEAFTVYALLVTPCKRHKQVLTTLQSNEEVEVLFGFGFFRVILLSFNLIFVGIPLTLVFSFGFD